MHKKLLSPILLLAFTINVFSSSNDWALWKGPNFTGISDEKDWNPEFLNKPLKINWKINVGQGYSNISISGNFMYTMGYDKKNKENILYCIDVSSGQEIWRYSYSNSKGQYEGPKSTPIIDEGMVYSLSQDGDLFCHEANSGKVLWQRQIAKEFGAEVPRWGFSSSVCIEGNMAIINACTNGLCFNKKTGELIWKSKPGHGNYATPVILKSDSGKFLAIYGKDNLYGININDGKVIWSYPWYAKYDIIAADPIIYNNQIFISTAYDVGCCLIDISNDKPKLVWQNKDLLTHFSTAIAVDGYIYGVDGNAGSGELKCLDIKTGNIKWSEDLGFGSIIISNGYIIMLNESGSLFIIEVNPNECKIVSSQNKLVSKLCWTAPVLCRQNIYLRNNQGDILSINAAL